MHASFPSLLPLGASSLYRAAQALSILKLDRSFDNLMSRTFTTIPWEVLENELGKALEHLKGVARA